MKKFAWMFVFSFCLSNFTYAMNSAQEVADKMASTRSVRHFNTPNGRTYRYEGVGFGRTQSEAYNRCCYSKSRLEVVDVGFAQDSRGNWYCCKRYK